MSSARPLVWLPALLVSIATFLWAGAQTPPLDIVATPSAGLVTDKMGAMATLKVRLACNASPCLSAPVQVLVRSDDPAQGRVRVPGGPLGTSLTLSFSNGTYYVDQTVEVVGIDDGYQSGPTAYTITLIASSTDTRIHGLVRTVTASNLDRIDHNVCVPGVVDAFLAIPATLEKLPIFADIAPMAAYRCPHLENEYNVQCGQHFQGVARTKHGPYLVLTGKGGGAEFFVNKLPAKQGIVGKWGNNSTTWVNDSQPNYPGLWQIAGWEHAGGLSLFGDFAALPLQKPGASAIQFFDFSNPEVPTWLSASDLNRGVYTHAGAVAVTKLNGKYLVAVQSNNPAEIQFYLSSGFDIRQPQTWTYKGKLATGDYGYPNLCFGVADFAATIQGMNFIDQCDGKLYLAATYNSGADGCNTGDGLNWLKLYEVNTAAVLAGTPATALTEVATRTFSCATEYLDYCNFAAGAGVYVVPETRQLLIYSTWYFHESLWSEHNGWAWRPFIMAAEFAPDTTPAGHQLLIPKQSQPLLSDGKLLIGTEGPDTCLWNRCVSDPVYSLRQRNVPLKDIHYLRVQFQPGTAWNAGFAAPFVQVDDNTRAHGGSVSWPYAFDVYPAPGRDPDTPLSGPGGAPEWNAFAGTVRFVEQDDQGDNFGGAAYSGWPRSWLRWKEECGQYATGSAEKAGLGVRFWSTGLDLSPTSTAILRDASVCLVDDRTGEIAPSWRVTVKRKSLNIPPALDSIGNRTVAEGSNLSFTIHGTDGNEDTLTYGAIAPPSGVSVNSVTGAVSWTPGPTQRGTYTLTFFATDGLAQATQTSTITVQPTNVPPDPSSSTADWKRTPRAGFPTSCVTATGPISKPTLCPQGDLRQVIDVTLIDYDGNPMAGVPKEEIATAGSCRLLTTAGNAACEPLNAQNQPTNWVSQVQADADTDANGKTTITLVGAIGDCTDLQIQARGHTLAVLAYRNTDFTPRTELTIQSGVVNSIEFNSFMNAMGRTDRDWMDFNCNGIIDNVIDFNIYSAHGTHACHVP